MSCKSWFRLVLLYTLAKKPHASFLEPAGRPKTSLKSMSDLIPLVLQAIAGPALSTNPFLSYGKPRFPNNNPQHGASSIRFDLVRTPKIFSDRWRVLQIHGFALLYNIPLPNISASSFWTPLGVPKRPQNLYLNWYPSSGTAHDDLEASLAYNHLPFVPM